MEGLNNLKLESGIIVFRPSKIIKYARVADIKINNKMFLALTKGLSNEGLTDPGAIIYVLKSKQDLKTDYEIQFVFHNGTYICVNPQIAEDLTLKYMFKIFKMKPKDHPIIEKQVTIKDPNSDLKHRFDFTFMLNNVLHIIEVKSVPVAYGNIAVFPSGYRKTIDDPISPRAISQMKLLNILGKSKKIKTYMIYVVQRDDIKSFSYNLGDHHYMEAVYDFINVKSIVLYMSWKKNNKNVFTHILKRVQYL
jgi:DNA-binding sugar fermentation-stimulating protein